MSNEAGAAFLSLVPSAGPEVEALVSSLTSGDLARVELSRGNMGMVRDGRGQGGT